MAKSFVALHHAFMETTEHMFHHTPKEMLNAIFLDSVLGAIVGFIGAPLMNYLFPVGLLSIPLIGIIAYGVFKLASFTVPAAGSNGLAIMIGFGMTLITFHLSLYIFLV